MVNAAGLVSLAGAQLNVGFQLAGQRVTLRLDGTQMAVISHDGYSSGPCPAPSPPATGTGCAAHAGPPPSRPARPGRSPSSGASPPGAALWSPPRKSTSASSTPARPFTVIAEDDHFTLVIDGETAGAVPRTTTREVRRYKAHATQAARAGRDQPAGDSRPSLTRRNTTEDGDRDPGPA